jgi:hypothetical protein
VVPDLNSKIAADERLDRVLVSTGDGMTLTRWGADQSLPVTAGRSLRAPHSDHEPS